MKNKKGHFVVVVFVFFKLSPIADLNFENSLLLSEKLLQLGS